MKYVAAICNGMNQTVVTFVGKPTRSYNKAHKIAEDVRPHLQAGLEVRPLELDRYTRESLAMFGTWNGS